MYKQREQNGPAISPDLLCIEHAWGDLGRAVSECLKQNSTLQDLQPFLREEWASISHQTSEHQTIVVQERSMNVNVIIVVSHIIYFWDTFFDDSCRD